MYMTHIYSKYLMSFLPDTGQFIASAILSAAVPVFIIRIKER